MNIANLAVHDSLAIYHLVPNARLWNNIVKYHIYLFITAQNACCLQQNTGCCSGKCPVLLKALYIHLRRLLQCKLTINPLQTIGAPSSTRKPMDILQKQKQ